MADDLDLDAAISVMRGGGWLPIPKAGQPAEKWQWQCVTCLPKPRSGSMPSTPASG